MKLDPSMKPSDQSTTTLSPEVFMLGESIHVTGSWEDCLNRKGYSSRGFFGPDEIPLLIKELREARPRPALLITQTLGSDRAGLVAARACKEIEPGLKVFVLTGYDPPRIRNECPDVIDVAMYVVFSRLEFWEEVARLIGAPRQVCQKTELRQTQPVVGLSGLA